jgi:benzoyl-CoA reductase/2-hydroxyglutaryl-CoA dehydratase subunit BcrC/BadD/HgdB
MLSELTETAKTLVNPALHQWKKEGGRVLGYTCSYLPREIATAAGLLPFRVRANSSTGTELSDAYFSSFNCSFARHCFDLALKGGYKFLDGVVFLNCCDHIRRIYDNWRRNIENPSYLKFMSLPQTNEAPQVVRFRGELEDFKTSLEEYFDVKINKEKLRDAIKTHNETRGLLRKIYNLRRKKNPPLSGAEMLAITVSGTAIPIQKYNLLLKELIELLGKKESNRAYRARVLVIGGILDDPAYIKIIEDQGALVVADSTCLGSRLFFEDVDENAEDPLMSLAEYILVKSPSCPRFGNREPRADFVRKLVKDYAIDGVICERMAFCEQWGFEQFMIERDLEKDGIPCLLLEREYRLNSIGQMRTRVQEFMEKMKGQAK